MCENSRGALFLQLQSLSSLAPPRVPQDSTAATADTTGSMPSASAPVHVGPVLDSGSNIVQDENSDKEQKMGE